MKFQIVVRGLAERDIIEAEDWYETQSPGLGVEFRQVLEELFDRLSATPRIYPRMHGAAHRAVLRRFPYAVYFMIDGRRVVIMACLDCRRNPRVHRARSD